MSGPYKIRYLSTAQTDLDEIFDYIVRDNPSAAISMLEKFDRSISQLADNPEIGVVPKDDRLDKLGYRMLIVEKYLVLYVLKANTVQIRRIIHGARKYGFLL
jgi:addiction module RelE/StbE family toxin